MACDYVGTQQCCVYPCLHCKGQVYRVVPMMYLGSLSGIAIPTLLTVAFWIIAKALVMVVAELGTAQDFFVRFLEVPLLSSLVYHVSTLLLSSLLYLGLF